VGVRIVALAIAFALLTAACTDDGGRYDHARDIAAEIQRSGFGCALHPSDFRVRARPGDSSLTCKVLDAQITITVLESEEPFDSLRRVEAKAADDTPKIFWLYGDNWIIATQDEDVLAPLEAKLGGERADNTDF